MYDYFNDHAEEDRAWDWLIECGYCTEEALQLATYLKGYSMDTMRKVLYVYEGTTTFPYEEDDYEE